MLCTRRLPVLSLLSPARLRWLFFGIRQRPFLAASHSFFPHCRSVMGACASSSASEDEPNFSSIEPDTKPTHLHSSLADILPPAANRYAVADTSSASPAATAANKAEETKEATFTTTTTEARPTIIPVTILTTSTDSVPQTKAKLDPKDFIVSKRSNETIVRRPGQIAGQSFMIEECTNCHIYLLDHSAAVNIDVCIGCVVVVGPCESSVFIRDCRDSTFVIACQQLRMRDSHNLTLLLSVAASQPTIESSDALRLSAFRYTYPQLASQFTAAGLSPFNAHWDNVHDFHAKDGLHWSYADYGTDPRTLGVQSGEAVLALSEHAADEAEARRGVAVETWGSRPLTSVERVLCVLRDEDEAKAWQLLAHFQPQLTHHTLHLLRTRHVRLTDDRAATIVGRERCQSSAGKGGWIGLEWDGTNCRQLLSEWIGAQQGWSSNAVVVVSAERTASSTESFFEAAAQV